jgi:hypothetical protein
MCAWSSYIFAPSLWLSDIYDVIVRIVLPAHVSKRGFVLVY